MEMKNIYSEVESDHVPLVGCDTHHTLLKLSKTVPRVQMRGHIILLSHDTGHVGEIVTNHTCGSD